MSVARHKSWTKLPDEQLLQQRFCDLHLSLRGTRVARAIKKLRGELLARRIRFAPHVWLADEWFTPDGVAGFAVPFYLAHPRLERLERQMLGKVEGANMNWLMRILRHETGHALDNACGLRRRKIWRDTFGPATLPYPSRYRARPGSRRYVHHLGEWYAQAHPAEDFAETFAVWLQPRSGWRRNYADWPALNKLRVVDALMQNVSCRKLAVSNRQKIEPLDEDQRTLAQHYLARAQQQIRYRRGQTDLLLRRIFGDAPARKGVASAAALLRGAKPQLARYLMRTGKVDRYTAFQILRVTIERAAHLQLWVRGTQRDSLRQVRWLLLRVLATYSRSRSPLFNL